MDTSQPESTRETEELREHRSSIELSSRRGYHPNIWSHEERNVRGRERKSSCNDIEGRQIKHIDSMVLPRKIAAPRRMAHADRGKK